MVCILRSLFGGHFDGLRRNVEVLASPPETILQYTKAKVSDDLLRIVSLQWISWLGHTAVE